MKAHNKAFTLIELIVVVTILAILWTVWFVSFQWYLTDTRDSVRLSDLSNISKNMEIAIVKWASLPMPEGSVDITASGNVISHQGYASKDVLANIWVHGWGKDPLTDEYYTYWVNKLRNKYQVIWFLENWEKIVSSFNQANASSSTDYPKSVWWSVWVLFDSAKRPIQKGNSSVDVVSTANQYKLYLWDKIEDVVSSTWWLLFSKIYSANTELLKNKDLASLDSSLVGYWDMETTMVDWGRTRLKDLSNYWNNWTCYENNSIVDCGGSSWPELVNWVNGKALKFSGVDKRDAIIVSWDSSIYNQNLTASAWIKWLESPQSEHFAAIFRIGNNYTEWIMLRYFYREPRMWFAISDWGIHNMIYWETPRDVWIHYAATFDWEKIKLYENWKLIKIEETRKTIEYLNKNLSIGCNWANTNNYKWLIDELRLYNRVLSDDEIDELYKIKKDS